MKFTCFGVFFRHLDAFGLGLNPLKYDQKYATGNLKPSTLNFTKPKDHLSMEQIYFFEGIFGEIGLLVL